jgi:hypothetical protein
MWQGKYSKAVGGDFSKKGGDSFEELKVLNVLHFVDGCLLP